jgi:O-methyltransferase involved in polyketide biosynthesis
MLLLNLEQTDESSKSGRIQRDFNQAGIRKDAQMTGKTAVTLQDVQATLLLPLWGRAQETMKTNPRLRDETAVRIIGQVNYDFSLIAGSVHDITQLEWILRSIYVDRTIRAFLTKHPRATIVNIGAGLDTTFERVDNGTLTWYDLDLPDVIDLRRKFIAETDRRKFIAGSFLDESWLRKIQMNDGILFMAAGVLYYFEESQLKSTLGRLAKTFPASELGFDACSPVGVKAANEQLIKKVGLDEKSFLRWGMWKSEQMKEWGIPFEFIEEYPMYKGMKKGLSFRNKIVATVADRYKMMYMVHLKFR